MEEGLIVLGALLMAARRVLSGLKNGAFYAKGRSLILNRALDKAVSNLHTVETPAWYAQFGGMFCFLLATDISWIGALSAILITMGSSALAGYHYQGFINIGSGLPFEHENENRKSEFSDWFWWYRPWYGKRRKWAALGGVISIIIGLII